MKKILIIILIAIAGGGYYAYQHGMLNTYLSPGVKSKLDHIDPNMTTTLYKWRDAQGQWQVSDQPPPAGIKYETLNYHKDTNVIPSEQFMKKPAR